jgi:broad specificity phosphatase PhoE
MDESKFGEIIMYLVRHALVDLDIEERIRGTQNVALNQEGEQEAGELADFFRDIKLSAVYSDDLERTYQTAISIAEPHHLEVHQDILLRSWDVGSDLEGKIISANHAEIRKLKLQPHIVPPGGESWGSAGERGMTALLKYTGIAFEEPFPIVLVLHGSLLQWMWRYMCGEGNGVDYDSTPIEPSGVIAVYATRLGYYCDILRKPKEESVHA